MRRVRKLATATGPFLETSRLTIEQRRLAFEHWVAYDLYSDWSKSASSQVHCPLSGCSSIFDNLESCLAHLTQCSWLSNAWYWCPFCRRPERFTELDYTFASARETGPTVRDDKPSLLLDHKGTKAKSGAARLLRSIGNRLALFSQRSESQSTASIHVPHTPEDRRQSNPAAASAPDIMAHEHKSALRDKAALPSSQGPDSSSFTGWRSEYQGRYFTPEIDGIAMLPAELSDGQQTSTWYPEPAELSNDSHGGHRPPEFIASTSTNSQAASRWPSYERWSSDDATDSGSSFHPNDSYASTTRLHPYQPQNLQQTTSPVESLQDDSKFEFLPHGSSKDPLSKFAGLYNTAEAKHSNVHVSIDPHRFKNRSIYSPVAFHTDPTIDISQTPTNKMANGDATDSMYQPQPPPYQNSDLQAFSFGDQAGSPHTSRPRHRRLAPKDSVNDPTLFSSDQYGGSVLIAQEFNKTMSDVNRTPYAVQHQTSDSSDLGLGSFREIQERQGQALLGSSQASYPVSSQQMSIPPFSPTNSTLSSGKRSGRLSGSSDDTQPTSAETSPVLQGPVSTLQSNARTQQVNVRGTSQCPSCLTQFTGCYQDRQSNLKRHVKYTCTQQEKLKCPTEGCNREYKRPDNLLKHRRTKHDIGQQLKRSNALKVKREPSVSTTF